MIKRTILKCGYRTEAQVIQDIDNSYLQFLKTFGAKTEINLFIGTVFTFSEKLRNGKIEQEYKFSGNELVAYYPEGTEDQLEWFKLFLDETTNSI